MILLWVGLGLLACFCLINGVCYVWLTPTPFTGRARWGVGARVAAGLHLLAYGLALFRLPFIVSPYLAKLVFYFLLQQRFAQWWQQPTTQVLRWLGDVANCLLLSVWLLSYSPGATAWLQVLFQMVIVAEMGRLFLEKGQMLFSGLWQALPHRSLAQWLQTSGWQHWCRPYIFYYYLNDKKRLLYIVRLLRSWSATDPTAAARLRYVRAFRVVDAQIDLRAGQVRDVARGEVWVHARWCSDPWLLIGVALRRSPWQFDPRYLRRPFYYRTEANPQMTRLVLQHAHFSLPFALYQLGHEIKSARFEIFYRGCRFLGLMLEAPVQADGTYLFDPLLNWLATRLGLPSSAAPPRPLWTDEEVMAELAQKSPEQLSIERLAIKYTYPQLYVSEVLWPAVCQLLSKPPETTSGTSQCG